MLLRTQLPNTSSTPFGVGNIRSQQQQVHWTYQIHFAKRISSQLLHRDLYYSLPPQTQQETISPLGRQITTTRQSSARKRFNVELETFDRNNQRSEFTRRRTIRMKLIIFTFFCQLNFLQNAKRKTEKKLITRFNKCRINCICLNSYKSIYAKINKFWVLNTIASKFLQNFMRLQGFIACIDVSLIACDQSESQHVHADVIVVSFSQAEFFPQIIEVLINSSNQKISVREI